MTGKKEKFGIVYLMKSKNMAMPKQYGAEPHWTKTMPKVSRREKTSALLNPSSNERTFACAYAAYSPYKSVRTTIF
jgi:hypothetical protein